MARFLDTNILLRFFTNDDEVKALRILALLERVERNEERVATSLLVVSETVLTLERAYKVSKHRTYEMVRDVIAPLGVQLPAKPRCIAALELHAMKNISFVDAYNALDMQSRGLTEIYTWDTDFDRIPEVTRVEPES